MINSIDLFSLKLVSFVGYERLIRKKKKFHEPPTHQLPS